VIGDAAGGLQFTHLAEHHAGILLRHAIFRMRWTKPSPVVPWCTYTDPELARVGLSEADAQHQGVAHRVYRFSFDEIDRARAEGETEGFAKIVTDPRASCSAQRRRSPRRRAHRRTVLALAKGWRTRATGIIHAYPTLRKSTRASPTS
jgi:pyruvate/2-oxoglutarate dehydrogenase complex dihydrolipoamide dehydrogenase (E3) component